MKVKLAAASAILALVVLTGCSATESEAEITVADACTEMMTAFEPVLDSLQLSTTAASKEAMDVHLEAIEKDLPAAAEVDGPAEFVKLRDALVADTESFVDEGRKTMAGDDSGIEAAQATMLQSAAKLDRYCGN